MMCMQAAVNDMHLQQATGRIPPGWNPSDQRKYSFRHWVVDLRLWQAATDADEVRHGPMVAMCLGGAARDIVREMDPNILANGRIIQEAQCNQIQQLGLEYLVDMLTRRFAPLEQEIQLESISDLYVAKVWQ